MAKYPAQVIGIMSGTSADGVDGVLLGMASARECSIDATEHREFPAQIRAQIDAVIASPKVDLHALGTLDAQLADHYAAVANALAARAAGEVLAVGCHGQTVRHAPDFEPPYTLQLGNGGRIAARCGLSVVTDFRAADLAAGGQGAPLAPAFHHAVFAHESETRAVLNLGGIANVTHLPAGSGDDGDANRSRRRR